uniref:Uncharacterized protein n=1 Tax=Anguilla anguilla TaxID=7936 RepID=A0A0E9V0Y4_ANGAN
MRGLYKINSKIKTFATFFSALFA